VTPPLATDPLAPLEGVPDLTLADCCRNRVKARAAALGVELRRESSTRTVWPAEWLPLGDELQEHLSSGGKLADFPGSVTAAAGGSDASTPGAQPLAPQSAVLSVTPPSGGSDALAALARLAAAITPPPPPPDPLAVARCLAEAVELGAWLSVAELARLLGVAPGTVRGWSSGHNPRPGFELERRKDGAAVWRRVSSSRD
jgi:hypothetical protein